MKSRSVSLDHSFVSSMCVALTLVFLVSGCRSNPADKLVAEADMLYQSYLDGDNVQARESLNALVVTHEKATKVRPAGRAWGLYRSYANLYVLDLHEGKKSAATVDLLKARYWLARKCELDGSPVEKVAEVIASHTPEKIIEGVEKWDNNATGGKGPRYRRELTEHGTVPLKAEQDID